MYRLLIVDDEQIARDSVYGLLATQNDMELELLTACSAVRAIPILETERIDIAIMDINMPQITGLELYKVVRKKWPQCKVIFLTGYSEFDYVYKVHKHARYILKADREEKLVEAVLESIREIENEMIITRFADADSEHKKRADCYRSNDFMNELIDGYTDVDLVDGGVFRDMNISLDISKKVFTLIVRCNSIAETSFGHRQLFYDKVMTLMDKYFFKDMKYLVTLYKKVNFFLLLQPEEPLPEAAVIRRLYSLCSLFQNALQLNAEESASILIPDQAMDFKRVIRSFDMLYDGVIRVDTGDTHIFSCKNTEVARETKHALSAQLSMEVVQSILNLEYSFETADRDEITEVFRTVRKSAQGVNDMNDLFFGEIYLRICSLLLKMIKRHEISVQSVFQQGIVNLYNISEHFSWSQAFSHLENTVQKTIDLHEKKRSEMQEGLAVKTKRYIQARLHEDISLTAIADHFHFCPEYLLRTFKKEEGVTVLQYINDLKVKRAKELLSNPELQVKDIAQMLGFGSSGYFIRFFKSKAGTSPQVYRRDKVNE